MITGNTETRKPWLIGGVLVFCLMIMAIPAGSWSAPQPTRRPNIVLVLIDDQDERASPYWAVLEKTKQLLQENGVTFRSAFAATPICCPSRSSILTGKYGHNTGVLTNGGEFGGYASFVSHGNLDKTVNKYLHDAGYKTMIVGKFLNGYEFTEDGPPPPIPPGWSEFYVDIDDGLQAYIGYGYSLYESRDGANGTVVKYGFADQDYITDVVARKSVDFINRAEASDEQPFFMYVATSAPHLPIPPARRHEQISQQWYGKLPQPPNYDEQDLSDKALWLRVTGDRRSQRLIWNETDFPHRMGSLYAVDEMVEQIVNTLAATGELENTYIFFTSDNGYNLGAHRLLHKMAPYEESLRVPMVVAGPGIRQGVEGRLALNIDLAPTFLEMAGLPIPDDVDGRTLGPLLRQEPGPWRSDFFAQYINGGAANGIGAELPSAYSYLVTATDVPTWRAVRTEQFILIEWNEDTANETHREYELYDLRLDPYQLDNVLATPAGQQQYAALFRQLKDRMEELSRCQGRSCRD